MTFDPDQKWFDTAYIRERTDTDEAILYCSPSGRVLGASNMMHSLLGGDLVGRNLNDLLEDSQAAQVVADGVEGRTTLMEVTVRDITFDLESHPWDDQPGMEMIFVPRGVREDSKKWNDANRTLLVAREINNSLSAPMTAVNMLFDRPGSEEDDLWKCTARQGLFRLLRISRGLEDSALAELGQLKPLYADLDLRAFLQDLLEKIKPICEKNRIALNWTLPEESVSCRAQPEMLLRLVCHLISNAMRAQPNGGGIEVSLKPGPREDVTLTVTDRGRVLSQVPEISFRPEESKSVLGSPRLRMGLPLAQVYAEAHGGRLMLLCGEKAGLVARLILPRNLDSAPSELRQHYREYEDSIDPILVELSTVADCGFYRFTPPPPLDYGNLLKF